MTSSAAPLVVLALSSCAWWIDAEDRDAWACEHWLSRGPWYLDADRDGYGSEEATRDACPDAALYTSTPGDCDDEDSGRSPGLTELCQDGVDQDCDGRDPELLTWYFDQDGDGYGADYLASQEACEDLDGMVTTPGDCDDADASVFAGADEEVCGDDLDQDCDGALACAVSGEVELLASGTPLGLVLALESGGGAALAAGEDLDGDGVADAAAGGEDAAWRLVAGQGRQAAAELLALDVESDGTTGQAVALLGSEDGAILVVGVPGYDEGALDNVGRLALVQTEGTGWVTGSEQDTRLGEAVAAAGQTLAVGVYSTEDSGLNTRWEVVLYDADALPGPGRGRAEGEIAEEARLEVSKGMGRSNLRIALGSSGAGLELATSAVASVSGSGSVSWFADPLTEGSTADFTLDDDEGSAEGGPGVALLDLNGDGHLDLAVGGTSLGAAAVFLGPASEAASTPDQVFSASEAGSVVLGAAGDVNGDGVEDLLVGAPEQATAWLVLGGATGSDSLSAAATLTGPADSLLGASLAGADMDGDGWSDLLLGAPAEDAVFLLWGGP